MDRRKKHSTNLDLSSLPDPFLPLHFHSEQAIAYASSTLRRVRLMKAIRYVVGGGVPVEHLLSFLRGPNTTRNLDGLPVWWCPWIHDLGLLVHAATRGLFSVSDSGQNDAIFGKIAIERHIRAVFFEGRDGMKPSLPRSFLNGASSRELDDWVTAHSRIFPTQRVIERRLVLICSELTAAAATMSAHNERFDWVYDNFPMFDHGGWPNNGHSVCQSIYESNGAPNMAKSLLCIVEDHAIDEVEI